MIRCNNCEAMFYDESKLALIESDNELALCCPDCKTDGYLMDMDMDLDSDKN